MSASMCDGTPKARWPSYVDGLLLLVKMLLKLLLKRVLEIETSVYPGPVPKHTARPLQANPGPARPRSEQQGWSRAPPGGGSRGTSEHMASFVVT